MPVYYGRRERFSRVRGNDLENKCAHLIGELPLQPQSMSLVDLQLWVFRLFRLHPETQDLDIKGFLKQRKTDFFDEESSEPDCCLEDYPWGMHEFLTGKCWSSFPNKLKRKKHVTQKFMLSTLSVTLRMT